jgi:Zn-dependent protease with chaperone function
MYCQNCGSQNADGARFCGKCYVPFATAGPLGPPPPPPPSVIPQTLPPPLPGFAPAVWQSKLPPQAYEHPSDTSTRNALQHTAGLDTLVRKLNSWGFEPILRVQLTGSYLRATPDRFPELHATLRKACDLLDSPIMPELYIAPGELNALTAGVEKPLILLNSAAIDLLTPEEMLFVIAHEVGHIKSAHVLYYQIAEFIPVIGEIVGAATFGISEIFGASLQLALLRWKRMSEYTADRAGLLACRDAEVALRVLMKLAGLPAKSYATANTEDFIAQAREFEAMDTDKLSMLAKFFSTMGASHPWTVMRAQELLKWVDDGSYDRILKAIEPAPALPPATSACKVCGYKLLGPETYCPGCGRALAEAKATS